MEIDKAVDLFKEKFSGLFSNKFDAVIIADIGSDIKLLNVELKPEIRIAALKIIETAPDKKEEALIKSLREFIPENNIQHKNAILVPALNFLMIKRLQLPVVPDAELTQAVKWQIKEDVPFDLSKAKVCYQIIKRSSRDDGTKIFDIICTVVEEEEIKRQVLLLKESGLGCVGVGLSCFGYAKIIERYFKEAKDEPIGILHLSENNCYIGIYREGRLGLYRELPITINKLKESLSATLISDKGKVQLSVDEIEETLFKGGIPINESDYTYKDKIAANQVLAMVRPNLERLTQEIKRSLTYYESQFKEGSIKKIFIAAEAIRIANLDKFLSNELSLLSLDVSLISLKDKIVSSSAIAFESLARSYAGFGLSLGLGEFNLLPQEFRTEKIEKFQKVSLRWVAFITFSLLFVSYIFAKAGIGMYQKRLDNTLIYLNALSEVKQTKEKAVALNNFIQEIRNSNATVVSLLKKISNITPKEIFFKELNLDYESKRGSITGFIKSQNLNPDIKLTGFIKEMNNSGYFVNTSIDSASKSDKEDMAVTNFKITFQLP